MSSQVDAVSMSCRCNKSGSCVYRGSISRTPRVRRCRRTRASPDRRIDWVGSAQAAQQHHVSAEKIQAIFEFESSDLFSAQEKAALRVAVHAGMVPNAVETEHMSELSKHFNDLQAIEVVAVISLFGFLNRWNDTMATTLESAPKHFASDQLASHGWVAGKHE